jgi:hypothetical protein
MYIQKTVENKTSIEDKLEVERRPSVKVSITTPTLHMSFNFNYTFEYCLLHFMNITIVCIVHIMYLDT